MLNAVS